MSPILLICCRCSNRSSLGQFLIVFCCGREMPSRPRYGSTVYTRRTSAGDAAEDGAGHEAGAAGVVVEEEATGDFAGGVDAGDRVAGRVLDLGVSGDLEAAEGEGDAGRHGIGLVGRLVEALGPVGLVDREAARREAVADVRVERGLRVWGGVERPYRLPKTARIGAF